MSKRPATATQADISRAIRAAKACGLPVLRVLIRADGVSIEIEGGAPIVVGATDQNLEREIVL
jgi:hypothetical protein